MGFFVVGLGLGVEGGGKWMGRCIYKYELVDVISFPPLLESDDPSHREGFEYSEFQSLCVEASKKR